MVVSPILWKNDLTNYMPLIVANYFNKLNGSLFPAFPWINFILAGAIFAKYFIQSVHAMKKEKFMRPITYIGLAMIVSGHLFYSGLFPGDIVSVSPNPIFFIERLGYILVFASLCWYFNKWRNVKKSFVLDASRESLLIYWLHLLVIYSLIWNGKSLEIIIGSTLNIFECATATLVLMILMVLVAKVWGWTKMKLPIYATKVAWGVVGVLFVIFLLN